MTREPIDLIRFKFFEWLPLTVEQRSEKNYPLTYTAFAQNHGVSRRVLNKWENEKEEERIIESGTDKEKAEFLLQIKPFALSGKNSRYADLYSTLKGWKINKTEETHKVEFTVTDRQQEYQNFIEWGRRETEATGICPMCHQRQILRLQPCLDTEPEHKADREVAALELPVGFA